ncbi:MAG: N-formylglutamate amidohydrolase [Phycisphaeraceae bacterium]|nr:N-formylglutamate amidohydrolase [Phycisphaeraceae bacterium]
MPDDNCDSAWALVVTCEHGGNRIPARCAPLFANRRGLLRTHRAWDPGALVLARRLSSATGSRLFYSATSRLVVDLNRSIGNDGLFSTATSSLPAKATKAILATYYAPYRRQVELHIARLLQRSAGAVHLSVHSFTPVIRGQRRSVDVGILFDPSRDSERVLCRRWLAALRAEFPRLRIRPNAPYRGTDDGFTTHLRTRFPADRYAGIELEINQRFVRRAGRPWNDLQRGVIASLRLVLAEPPFGTAARDR